MDGQAGGLVFARFHLASGPNVAAHAVLGGVKGNEVDVLCEDIYGGTQLGIDPARIGEQADALALQAGEAAVAQDFYAGLDAGAGGNGHYKRRCAKKVTKKVAIQHIITRTKKPMYPSACCK